MQIYNYDENTNEFLYTSEARPNPLEKGKFLIPANATEIQPIEVLSDEVAIFDGKNWNKKIDLRGSKIYNKDTGQEFTLNSLGEIPTQFTTIKPEALFKPKFENEKWVETAIIYNDKIINNEQDLENTYIEGLIDLLPEIVQEIKYLFTPKLSDKIDALLTSKEQIKQEKAQEIGKNEIN